MSNHVSSRERNWIFEIWPHIVTWLNKNYITLVNNFYICKSPFSIHIHLLFHWAALISVQSIFMYNNTCYQPPQWKIAGIRVFIGNMYCWVNMYYGEVVLQLSVIQLEFNMQVTDIQNKGMKQRKQICMVNDMIVNQKETFALSF